MLVTKPLGLAPFTRALDIVLLVLTAGLSTSAGGSDVHKNHLCCCLTFLYQLPRLCNHTALIMRDSFLFSTEVFALGSVAYPANLPHRAL